MDDAVNPGTHHVNLPKSRFPEIAISGKRLFDLYTCNLPTITSWGADFFDPDVLAKGNTSEIILVITLLLTCW